MQSYSRRRLNSSSWMILFAVSTLALAFAGCGEGTGAVEFEESEAAAPSPDSGAETGVAAQALAPGFPGGSWTKSCDLKNTVGFLDKSGKMTSMLTNCRTKKGTWRGTGLTRSECPRWCAWNNDGYLTCGGC